MRLIDADAFCEAIKEATDSIVKSGSSLTTKVIVISESELIKNLLCGEPTIDAVPVVRCKDCKWWEYEDTWDGHQVGRCLFVEMLTDTDGYCYRAVRKEVQDGQN